MRPLRVAFVAPFGVSRRGTTLARVIPLAEALAARGHAVRVVVPDWDCPSPPLRRYLAGDAEIIHLRSPRAGRRLVSLRLLRQVLDASLVGDPDFIHCFKPIGYSGAAAVLVKSLARPGGWSGRLAVDTDDLEGSEGWATLAGRPSWQAQLLDRQERAALKAADLVTAASDFLARRSSLLVSPDARVCRLPNAARSRASQGATLPQYSKQSAPKLLVYTRFNEFEPNRGADILAAVLLQAPSAKLVVVGDGPPELVKRFFERLRSRGVSERTEWRGELSGEALSDALTSDCAALWLFEDTPVNRARSPAKLLELLAAGRPVVLEAVGEAARLPPEVVRSVQPGMASSAVRATVELLTETTTRRRLGERAHRYASTEWTWAKAAAQLSTVYYT